MTFRDWLPHLVTDHHAAMLDEEASATFSPDRSYRYALTRRWDPTKPLAVWVMCNPSTADAFDVDPTIRRVISFSRAWQAGGLLVVNLFALRSTDPKVLYSHADPVGADNDAVIAWWLSIDAEPVGPVIAAWGVHGQHQGRAAQVASLLEARKVRPLCLGVTKDGHPKHPLYVPNGTPTVDYPVTGSTDAAVEGIDLQADDPGTGKTTVEVSR